MADIPIIDSPAAIVITASRVEQEQAETPASVTIITEERAQRLGEPLASALLRLVPSAALAVSGPMGSQTQLRIRGSEANHTLLFVDGIRANDPAAGNEPRLELLNADIASHMEVVRGPQSALWGSEAIGGVVSVTSTGADSPASGSAELGSNGFFRLGASGRIAADAFDVAIGGGLQRSGGIDALSPGTGDRDGYRNGAIRARVVWRSVTGLELGASGFAIRARSQFDGFDPVTFLRADTLDESRNRLGAARLFAGYEAGGWKIRGGASALQSTNRNLLDRAEINRTHATRRSAQLQVERELTTGPVHHTLIAAADMDRESFKARDVVYGGFSNQDRDRTHRAITGEWRAEAGAFIGDLAVRRDLFNRFKDATTLRASALFGLGSGFALTASYGEGIAQPTFFDLYGFFPGSFVGNPALRPERSRGIEGGLRYARGRLSTALTLYRQRLKDEIIDVFDPATFQSTTENAIGRSRRAGAEVETSLDLGRSLHATATYAYLNARERTDPLGRAVKELRRPRHSGSIVLDGSRGRLSYGTSIAYIGTRTDRDFDRFPAATVRLGSYWLANGKVAWRVTRELELFGRVANAFDANYQDVVGYRTEGRSAYAGVRLGLGS